LFILGFMMSCAVLWHHH